MVDALPIVVVALLWVLVPAVMQTSRVLLPMALAHVQRPARVHALVAARGVATRREDLLLQKRVLLMQRLRVRVGQRTMGALAQVRVDLLVRRHVRLVWEFALVLRQHFVKQIRVVEVD